MSLCGRPTALLMANLTRMLAIFEADRTLDAGEVVRCVPVCGREMPCCFLARASREVVRREGMERILPAKKRVLAEFCRGLVRDGS